MSFATSFPLCEIPTGRVAYTAMMILAALAFAIARWLQPERLSLSTLTGKQKAALLLAAFIGGAYAARLGVLIEQIPRTGVQWGWLMFLGDGKTITTGLIGAYLGVEVAKKILGIRYKTGDSFALPLAIGLAIGRWGCFFLGCCYGKETTLPWGVDFSPIASGLRHPTQIYESMFHLCCVGILYELIRRRMFQHQLLKLYLIAYCCYRFVTEWIRPAESFALGLTFYQWVTMLFAIFLVIQWQLDERQKKTEAIHLTS